VIHLPTYFVEKGYATVATLRNKKGETPIVLAKRNKHLDCIFVLESLIEDSQKLDELVAMVEETGVGPSKSKNSEKNEVKKRSQRKEPKKKPHLVRNTHSKESSNVTNDDGLSIPMRG